jgi:hypothetical protein
MTLTIHRPTARKPAKPSPFLMQRADAARRHGHSNPERLLTQEEGRGPAKCLLNCMHTCAERRNEIPA